MQGSVWRFSAGQVRRDALLTCLPVTVWVGRMAFVPEGQADRSQARSAWVGMQRGPRPGGTVEVIVSPEWR